MASGEEVCPSWWVGSMRSGGSCGHDTTSINGVHQTDPLGPHVTLCYKDENQLVHGTHVASHGYVRGKDDIGFVCATHTGEKLDSAKRQQGKKTIWPSEK